jgi:enamine deaminase RidA (YjgF/YER057c/UK114 family)
MPYTQIHSPAVHQLPVPYSLVGVSSGSNLIHVSGQVALDANGALVGKEIWRLKSCRRWPIKALVEAAGGRVSDIVRIGIFVTDRAHFPIVMEVRRRVFSPPYPTATALVVSGLVNPDWLVEIDAMAHIA